MLLLGKMLAEYAMVVLQLVIAVFLPCRIRAFVHSGNDALCWPPTLRLQANLKAVLNFAISDLDMDSLFCILSDKYLLLDVPGAGSPEMMNCCHSGCDNCAYSRIFDCMTAARPKWIALYPYRKLVDGREHTPPWRALFPTANTVAQVNKDDFTARLNALPKRISMGPESSWSAITDHKFSIDFLNLFWHRVIAATSPAGQTLSAEQVMHYF